MTWTSRSRARLAAVVLAGCTQEYDIVAEPPNVDPGDVTACGFSPIPGTRLSVYDCNPVFTSTEEAWGAEVDAVGFHTTMVMGHPFYQIWYSARPDGQDTGNYGLGYAVSGDGTEWDAHPANPLLEAPANTWDQDAMDAIQVVWDPDSEQYILAYQGYNLGTSEWGLGIATSFDGVDWSRIADPVIDFSADIGGVSYCWPLAISKTDRGGLTGYIAGQPGAGNVCQIYPVYATNLVTWSPSNQPLLRAGPQAYDAAGMASAAVVEHDGTSYLFYVGFEEWEQHDGYQSSLHHHLNLATSADGQSWTKSPDNPLPVNLVPSEGLVSAVAAQAVGTRIHLWVTDYYEDIGASAVGYYYFEPGIEPHP